MEPLTPDELRAAGFLAAKTFDREKKELDAYILMARTVFDAALALAEKFPEQSDGYRTVALNTSFNIAAACWPGWEDAHPNISAEQRALALAMCRFNVATGESLDKPPDRRSNGNWILGAHLLAGGEYDEARESFRAAAAFGEQAGSKDSALMNRGWMLVCDILSGDGTKRDELTALTAELESLGEDGKFYAGQYEPALKVFG